MPSKTATWNLELVFRALSDPTRLRILSLLVQGELCVCDLVAVLDVPQPTASRHLAYLRRAGLVIVRKAGLWSYYRLVPAQSEFHEKLLACLAACYEPSPQLQRDRRQLTVINQRGCCE